MLTLVVPHTNGDSTEVLPHTVAPQTNVVPCNVGVHTLVVPHTNGDNTDVVPHKLVPVKLPFKVTSSLNVISLPPVKELNASAQTVPEALMLPDTVKASVGTLVPIPTLPPVCMFVADNKGATAQLLPFNIGVLTLVVPHTNGDNTDVLPQVTAPHTNVVPCTVGVQTLVEPHTNGDDTLVVKQPAGVHTLVEPHTFVPDNNGEHPQLVAPT